MKQADLSAFWTTFVRLERSLLAGDEADRQSALDDLLVALERVDSRLYLHIGHRKDGQDLLLSAEGFYDLGPALDALLALAPERPGWGYRGLLHGEIAFGQRNLELFPDDADGDALWRIAQDVDALWRERDVDFEHAFPSREGAEQFAAALTEPTELRVLDDGAYNVRVVRRLPIRHESIVDTEEELADIAASFGGRPDGWGCLGD